MSLRGFSIKGILSFAALAGLTTLSYQQTLTRRSQFAAEDDILYLPRVDALRFMSLGHHELAASLVFIRATVYFGGELGSKDRKYTWMDNYLDTITRLDPRFELAYRWAGSAIMYNGTTITNSSVERANQFLARGAKEFPKSWQLPWMIGCNYLFEMKSDDPVKKAEWERIGGDWIRQAALTGSAPAWASLLASQIMRKTGRGEAAIRYLEEVYATTSDDDTRQQIRNRLVSLRSQVAAEGLESNAKLFDGARKATLPYAHPDLFVLLGPPPSPRLDPEFLAHDEVLEEARRSEEAMRNQRAPEESATAPRGGAAPRAAGGKAK